MGELGPRLCCEVVSVGGGGDVPLLPLAVIGRVGPEGIRAGELALSLTGYSTQNRTCTSPGQHSEVGPDGRGTGEPVPRA